MHVSTDGACPRETHAIIPNFVCTDSLCATHVDTVVFPMPPIPQNPICGVDESESTAASTISILGVTNNPRGNTGTIAGSLQRRSVPYPLALLLVPWDTFAWLLSSRSRSSSSRISASENMSSPHAPTSNDSVLSLVSDAQSLASFARRTPGTRWRTWSINLPIPSRTDAPACIGVQMEPDVKIPSHPFAVKFSCTSQE